MKAIVQAQLMRDAADVERYHTQRTLRSQSVGAHSFNMLMLVDLLAPDARKQVFQAVIHHDLPELFTGDMPGPFKRASANLHVLMEELETDLAPLYRDLGLTPAEELLIKWADKVELVMWCIEEVRMGNTFAAGPASTAMQWLVEMAQPNAACSAFLNQLAEYCAGHIAPVYKECI